METLDAYLNFLLSKYSLIENVPGGFADLCEPISQAHAELMDHGRRVMMTRAEAIERLDAILGALPPITELATQLSVSSNQIDPHVSAIREATTLIRDAIEAQDIDGFNE